MIFTNFDNLIRQETQRAIKSILESSLSKDADEERSRQERQQAAITSRSLNASDDPPEKKEEADEEAPDNKEDDNNKKEKREDRSKGKGTADSPKLKTPKKSQLENPQVSLAIDKLNALRGGRSLKDPEVKKSFTQYYESLTVEEKQSLAVFLTAIAGILAGTADGADAIDPGDVGLRVKDTDKVVKKDTTKSKSKVGTEDNPIIVGEVANKKMIKKALREYSKYQ